MNMLAPCDQHTAPSGAMVCPFPLLIALPAVPRGTQPTAPVLAMLRSRALDLTEAAVVPVDSGGSGGGGGGGIVGGVGTAERRLRRMLRRRWWWVDGCRVAMVAAVR